jgi:hypothetical protein
MENQTKLSVKPTDIQNNVVLAQALLLTLNQDSPLRKELELFQKQAISQLPVKAQQWLSREITSSKTEALGEVLKDHFGVYNGVHAEVYSATYKLLNSLSLMDLRAANVGKYKTLLKFILDEAEADVAGEGSCLLYSDGYLTFKMMSHGK